MTLAAWGITKTREAEVARLLGRLWPNLRAVSPAQRLIYTITVLVCDPNGCIAPRVLDAALTDPELSGRALFLLAAVRYQKGDGGEWTP